MIACIKSLRYHSSASSGINDHCAWGPSSRKMIGTQRKEIWLVGYNTALEHENIYSWRGLRRNRFAAYLGPYKNSRN